MNIFEDIVNYETENMRIDRYLKKMCKNETMSAIFRSLKNGNVKINNKKVKENYRLCLNDKISIKFLDVKLSKKNDLKKLNYDKKYFENIIIYENENFFIVNKPEKIAMHKGTGHEYGISEIYKDIFGENVNFANRLDYETRGLVIGCKNMRFLRYISEKIRNNDVEKKYVALVHGEIEKDEFIVENYLETTENLVKVYEKNNNKGKIAITKFYKKNVDNNKTLLEIELITGRKHQIRAQLSNLGFPIVGDRKYGIKDKSNTFYLCCYFVAFDDYSFQINKKVF